MSDGAWSSMFKSGRCGSVGHEFNKSWSITISLHNGLFCFNQIRALRTFSVQITRGFAFLSSHSFEGLLLPTKMAQTGVSPESKDGGYVFERCLGSAGYTIMCLHSPLWWLGLLPLESSLASPSPFKWISHIFTLCHAINASSTTDSPFSSTGTLPRLRSFASDNGGFFFFFITKQ